MASAPVLNAEFSLISSLAEQLAEIRAEMLQLEKAYDPVLKELPETNRISGRNLLHYLALRRRDVRDLQTDLAALGLSSLGRTESNVLGGLDAVLSLLYRLNRQPSTADWEPTAGGFSPGHETLSRHTRDLLGLQPADRAVRIMVTMPTEAAHDYRLVRDLLSGGMDCMRINCAHDGPAAWENMIRHLKRARNETGRRCRILMDIAGPKLRTGSLRPGPAVIKLRPHRDKTGNVLAPARVAVISAHHPRPVNTVVDAVLSVRDPLPPTLAAGDKIKFEDARGRKRNMIVSAVEDQMLIAELEKTTYIVPGIILHVCSGPGSSRLHVGPVPPTEQPIVLRPGDVLTLTSDSIPGMPATHDNHGRLLTPASIGVTIPEIFRDVRPGANIWFDDGEIGGVVRCVEPEQIKVEITQARATGSKLRSDKGINLPDTDLHIPCLTEKDLQDLAFVVQHADIVGLSFVRNENDVSELHKELTKLNGKNLAVILKIETRAAFERLPKLLLAAMKRERFGVMIARGDLAVECGYERTAEIQEEILWICEAAHAPVIWATQVLESLAKTGIPSRAEVTDAAMAERAECVMLNKGPFIRNALTTLDNILRRMEAHQSKKRSMLRSLRLAQEAP